MFYDNALKNSGKDETSKVLPTGEQFEISSGDLRAVITEVGATLRSFEVAGSEVLAGFGPEAMSDFSRGQVLLPWPNRIDHGRYEFMGKKHQLPINEVERDCALHGLVRWLRWKLLSRDESGITLGMRLYPQEGYPFALDLQVEYEISPGALSIRTTAENLGSSPLPYGASNHPYFTVGTPTVDTALLRLPAETYYETDDRLIPTGRASVAGTGYDFREAREVGTVKLDTCFTDLRPDEDGKARVTLSHPGGSPEIGISMDEHYSFVQVFTSDTLPQEKLRRALAIEPMTCAPNAFNTGEGLIRLEPGQSFASVWEIEVS